MEIIFTNTIDGVSLEYSPKPASKMIPEWYKKTPPHMKDMLDALRNSETTSTVKKCIPVLDSLSTGYILPSYTDIYIIKNEEKLTEYYVSSAAGIEFHPISQSPYAPYMNHEKYPKWINPWSIKTPKGYSCLFINPVHKGNKYLTILEGVVDTDSYVPTINFPFVLNDMSFEGIIPAGTPMVQVIPFKRDEWQMKLGGEKELQEISDVNKKLNSHFFDRYKKMFWNKKSFT